MTPAEKMFKEIPYGYDKKALIVDRIYLFSLNMDIQEFSNFLKKLEKNFNFRIHITYASSYYSIHAEIKNITEIKW